MAVLGCDAAQYRTRNARGSAAASSLSTAVAALPSFDGRKISVVDQGIESLDVLPERYSTTKTLYISKNSLSSLAGIEQFPSLRALSAADNALSDLKCLRALPAAGIQLEAACFQGNPFAELPNYRAHVIATLGPSLAMLDNRAVSAAERRAAAAAVAHEATMLSLMTANACLVHKLGRAVQLVKLHCELQCAVASGQYGSTVAARDAAARPPDASLDGGGCGAKLVLRLWDYEGSLGDEERHAIGLAIRWEVARRHCRLAAAAAAGKAVGSNKLWQQAFAQVMLLQQDAIAGLMQMLEQARVEASSLLAPLSRPSSPRKRLVLEREREAIERVRQDREALILELRDALLGLADVPAHLAAPQRAAQFEARIRQLHAALEAAGDGVSAPQQASKGETDTARGAAGKEWAIAAVRPGLERRQPLIGKPSSPVKQPAETQPTAAHPGSGCGARSNSALRPACGQGYPLQRQRRWQPDDGLSAYIGEEQEAPHSPSRPLHNSREDLWAATATQAAVPAGSKEPHFEPSVELRRPGQEGAVSLPPESPHSGLRTILQLLAQQGRHEQADALQAILAEHEASAAELQAASHQLAVALSESQRSSHRLEVQLADQRAAAEEASAAAAARDQRQTEQLHDLDKQLAGMVSSHSALRAELHQLEADRQRLVQQAAAERSQLQEKAAAEWEEARVHAERLAARVAELEGQKAVELRLTVVSHESEWRAEAARAAAFQTRVEELTTALASQQQREQQQQRLQQQRERLEIACLALARRVILRRAIAHWRAAAAECACLADKHRQASSLRHRRLLAAGLSGWRHVAQRSKALTSRSQQLQLRRMQHTWQQWRAYCLDCVLHRGLCAGADMHRDSALQRSCLAAWSQHTAACRQVDLPAQHRIMQAAAVLQRRRLLGSCFGAWRRYMQAAVLPRMAQVEVLLLQSSMAFQRRGLAAWQQYMVQRRSTCMLQHLADRHRSKSLLEGWRAAAAQAKQKHTASLRSELSSRAAMLHRCWHAWRQGVQEQHHRSAQRALAQQHRRQKLLVGCWRGWEEWAVRSRDLKQRDVTRRLAAALQGWRWVAQVAEKRRLAEAYHQHRCRRSFRAALRAWRAATAYRRHQRQQLAYASSWMRRCLLARLLAGWRRATLAGKLCASLEAVTQLQGAVECMQLELQCKAERINALQAMREEALGHSECMAIQVSTLEADLAAARHQAAELQQAADAAQVQQRAAAEALGAAVAARSTAEANCAAALGQRDAAVAGKAEAEAAHATGSAARLEAEQVAAAACAEAQATSAAAAAAMTQAAAASAALEQLLAEHEEAQAQLRQAQEDQRALSAELEQALSEARHSAGMLEGVQAECGSLRRKKEAAEQGSAAAAAEKHDALRQAGRLAALCEEGQQQCEQLRQQLAQAEGLLVSQGALQDELCRVSDLKRQLQADKSSLQSQLDRLNSALKLAEAHSLSSQQSVDALRLQQQQLQARTEAAEAEALAAAAQTAAKLQQAASDTATVLGERDRLAVTVRQLAADKAACEAAVAELQGQLRHSNTMLESCRRSLSECCSARAAADDEALSLSEQLRSLKADQLLKEATIKSLSRENSQRGDRLRLLHVQVERLSQQVQSANGGGQSGGTTPLSSSMRQCSASPPAAAASARSEGAPGCSWAAGSSSANRLQPREWFAPQPTQQQQQQQQQQQTQQAAAAFRFPATSAAPAAPAGSPAASFISLASPRQPSLGHSSGGAIPAWRTG